METVILTVMFFLVGVALVILGAVTDQMMKEIERLKQQQIGHVRACHGGKK